ncbi:MAG TPA: ABC transporter permease subunit [Thermodesulfobacteriota bacterium]|nr:ABC transporter permease subunit [Thermodesulfobacteriota bacterium]
MELKNILLITGKDMRESIKNRWFVLYTASFSVLAILILTAASGGGQISGFSGYGRTAASLINLVLLFVPLIALVTGAISISGERENGTLQYLLSQPVTKSEVFIGKFIGVLIPIWFSISLGFGLAGIGVALKGGAGGITDYVLTALMSGLLAASLLSVGFVVSVFSGKASKAIGIAVFLWLLFIILGDLGIMGTAAVMDLGIKQVFVLAVLNPAEVFKIASVLLLSPRYEILGPVGVYAVRTFGSGGIVLLLVSILSLWTIVPLALAHLTFSVFRREEL